jgi:hypothetical protein
MGWSVGQDRAVRVRTPSGRHRGLRPDQPQFGDTGRPETPIRSFEANACCSGATNHTTTLARVAQARLADLHPPADRHGR